MSITMPDYFAAIVNFLRDQPVVTDITTEIVMRPIGSDANLEHPIRNMVTVTGVQGFPLYQGLIMSPFFELRTWGSNGYEAMKLWRACHSVLVPVSGSSDFRKNGCHVYNISLVNTPIPLIDPTGWESRSTIYRANVREIPYT